MPNTVTPADADAFEQFVIKWQGRLNLSDWRIVRSQRKPPKGAMADIYKCDLEARLASYRIGVDWGAEEITPEMIERTAVHELLHIFLYELIELAKDSDTQGDVLGSAEHRVINVLERLLVPSKGDHA